MAVQTTVTLTHRNEQIQTIKNKLLHPSTKPREQLKSMMNFLNALLGGDRDGKLVVQVNSGDAVAASGTITMSSFAADDTITVGSQVFTSKASPSGNNQFLSTGGDTAVAAAAVVKINAHPTLSPYISASSNGAVITITSLVLGDIGNNIALAISAHGSVSAAHCASGVNATTYSTINTYHAGV